MLFQLKSEMSVANKASLPLRRLFLIIISKEQIVTVTIANFSYFHIVFWVMCAQQHIYILSFCVNGTDEWIILFMYVYMNIYYYY